MRSQKVEAEFLGAFEQQVLLAVLRLDDDAYGMKVRREIEQQTGRRTSIGAVYATLQRLEEKRLVTSWEASGTTAREGRPRRFFKVEAAGVEALRRSIQAVKNLADGLEPVLI